MQYRAASLSLVAQCDEAARGSLASASFPGAHRFHEGTLGAVRHPDAIGTTIVISLNQRFE
jgi:Enoyl-(Acyl carrier protein) reductase